jgi:hypothetical protein
MIPSELLYGVKGMGCGDYPLAQLSSSPERNVVQGRQNYPIKAVVFHGSYGPSIVERLQGHSNQQSFHYIVLINGSIVQMVREKDQALHCGTIDRESHFYRLPSPNLLSIGVMIERNEGNNNHLPLLQLSSIVTLVHDIASRYSPLAVYTHDQFCVGNNCPGYPFPYGKFLQIEGVVPNWVKYQNFRGEFCASSIPFFSFPHENSEHLYDCQGSDPAEFCAWVHGQGVADGRFGVPNHVWYFRRGGGFCPAAFVDVEVPPYGPVPPQI